MRKHSKMLSAAAFLAGLTVAGLLVASWRAPAGAQTGASVRVSATAPAPLKIEGAQPFLVARDVTPQGTPESTGELSVTNSSDDQQLLLFRASTTDTRAAAALDVSIKAGDYRIYEGSLSGLSGWAPGSITISPDQTLALQLTVTASGNGSPAGKGDTVDVDLDVQPGAKSGVGP